MSNFSVAWTYKIHEDADRHLDNLGPAARAEITAWLEKRIQGAANPGQFGKPLRGSKHGLWRYRVRDYRIVCRLENKILVVVVVAVGHRSTVYED
ncbi:MAG: type II toxin-antitoxin system RelE/ParE family toxin [Verrucomicrobia bacterium]|nr:type II toxin-antitoxin system RelE/ParE family toxin [Verrucomicrobiota bacterium]